MKVVILSISHVETVFYLQRSYCSGSENKKKKRFCVYLPVERFRPSRASYFNVTFK